MYVTYVAGMDREVTPTRRGAADKKGHGAAALRAYSHGRPDALISGGVPGRSVEGRSDGRLPMNGNG